MIELLPSGAAHLVAMRVSGRVDGNDLQTIIDAIEAAKHQHPRISFYVELDQMRWMTATALLRDVGYGLTQLSELSHYYRAAVVSDKRWVRRLVRLEDRLFRSLEMRVFPTHQHDTALEWARHLPEAPEPAVAGAAAG
ncbi:SpoIIAA-like [Franzmannia pantelleriensis]|uniref:SpoIIAA-like n=1 Tax=Franzmannia pantelleriensis TaxID=48727 RepID=A0A1G9JZT3_9GAMM|nr:STAS/SEC14 domain-containing protein [Halomonas pantelleriensis]SDL43170.1 SpoIIAA-like [Halomonas pantelleriensis]